MVLRYWEVGGLAKIILINFQGIKESVLNFTQLNGAAVYSSCTIQLEIRC